MTRQLRVSGAVLLLVVAGLATAPAVLAGDPCFHGYSIPPVTTEAATAVGMEPCAFVPTNVTVAAGSTVSFTNTSGEPHILTGANQTWGDREKEIAPGATITMTFGTPGVYAFSCALHRGMSGAVIVGDAVAANDVSPAALTGSSGSTGDGGTLGLLAIIALAGLAAAGWGVAALQRRRGAAVPARGVPPA